MTNWTRSRWLSWSLSHVRAVEPRDLGEDALGTLDGFDHAGLHDRVLAAERDAVVLTAAGGGVVVVDRGVGDRLAGDRVRMLAGLLEPHQGTVISHDLAVLGEHEDGHLGVAVLPLRGDVRGDHAVPAGLGARPVPVMDQLLHRRVA